MFLMSLNGFPRKVIVSPGFGAGWSTWIGSVEGLGKFLGEHPLLVKAIEDGDTLEQPVPGESFKKLSDPLQSIVKEAIRVGFLDGNPFTDMPQMRRDR